MQTVCVYLGAKLGINPTYLDATKELGKDLAKDNVTLVYGGSNIGLMGTLADTVMKYGGRVVGIIPEYFNKEERHTNISELHIVTSMQERKKMMEQYADGFIALPGGLGTLEEIFELINAAKLQLHNKPFFLLNIENYFTKLIEFIDSAVYEGFLTLEQRALINVITNHNVMLKQLKGIS